ncbi:probable spastin homolog spas-1 isoform X2 [Salvia splendens]|uniref:probable spastin homolog spas-1 isoform X2 n=1 Tax=Salvia splendens TaxID=180675 RepID=UPI001C253CD8|nr:probable spastin homolog spas-1 isoform X2 [Salvia splendens]
MATVRRLARALTSRRSIASAKTLNPRPYLSPIPPLPLSAAPLCNRSFEQQKSYGPDGWKPEGLPNFLAHTALAGLLGFGMLNVALADGDEEDAKSSPLPKSSSPLPESSSSLPEYAKVPPSLESSPAARQQNLDEIAKKDKARLIELLKNKGGRTGSCPNFTVSVKGPKVSIKFQVPPSAEIPFLIANFVSRLGVKAEDNSVGSDMILRAWDSGVAWQLALSRPTAPKGANGDQGDANGKSVESTDNEELCIVIFRPLISSDKAEIELMKQGSFTSEELDALASVLQLAGKPRSFGLGPKGGAAQVPAVDKTISNLEGMGVKIYGLKSPNLEDPNADISWDNIAGYDNQKREIEDTILLALKSPEVYDDIARGTRCKFETNRPRAVLFEGPPGTGKTSCARVIANQAKVPLLYVPLEIVMSKYYGESERLLGKVFSLANELQEGAIIFLDEVDSLATTRDSDIHEATRRLLSVLLRQIDGFEQEKKVVVIAATNRKQDLDPALLSRFDSMITFAIPDQQTREAIVTQYAKHLTTSEIAELARATEEMSGRDIRDVCQQAERQWASKKNEEQSSLPPLREYIESAVKRRTAIRSVTNQIGNPSPLSKKPQFDFM